MRLSIEAVLDYGFPAPADVLLFACAEQSLVAAARTHRPDLSAGPIGRARRRRIGTSPHPSTHCGAAPSGTAPQCCGRGLLRPRPSRRAGA